MDKLTEIRKAYIERLAKVIEVNPGFRVDAVTVQMDVSYLLQLVETQAKALKFYANDDNYNLDLPSGYEPVILDCGQRAREALTQV